MKLILLFTLFLFVSCSSRTGRQIASVEVIELGEVEPSQGKLRLYPVENQEQEHFEFYLELKNEAHQLVDVDARDVQVKHSKEELPFEFLRLGKGKYLITVEREFSDLAKLKFVVQGKPIKNTLQTLPRPYKKNSELKVISNHRHELKLRLTLRNELGKLVDVPQGPEIDVEGEGDLTEIKPVKKGVWEFSVIYPEQDQIFHISVRANGAHFRRFLRFQHIEK